MKECADRLDRRSPLLLAAVDCRWFADCCRLLYAILLRSVPGICLRQWPGQSWSRRALETL